MACTVTTQGTTIDCSTAPGIGATHSWSVTLRGQGSGFVGGGAIATSYALPTVSSIAGGAMSTQGRTPVILNGDNFGPLGSPLRAFYRNAFGTVYMATDCTGTQASTIMSCRSVEGVGPSTAWLVEVGGRNGSGFSVATNSYASPSLDSIVSPQPLDTRGGTVVTLAGQNFGALGAAAVNATYSGGSTGQVFALNASRCSVVVAHTQIACTTLAGVGLGFRWTVTVASLSSASSLFSSAYAAPVVSDLRASLTSAALAAMPTTGGSTIILSGSHFGSVGGVPVTCWYGSTGSPSTSYNATSCSITVTFSEITCTSAPGVGTGLRVAVGVAGQTSSLSSGTLAYAAPNITGITPRMISTIGDQAVVVVREEGGGHNTGPAVLLHVVAPLTSRGLDSRCMLWV